MSEAKKSPMQAFFSLYFLCSNKLQDVLFALKEVMQVADMLYEHGLLLHYLLLLTFQSGGPWRPNQSNPEWLTDWGSDSWINMPSISSETSEKLLPLIIVSALHAWTSASLLNNHLSVKLKAAKSIFSPSVWIKIKHSFFFWCFKKVRTIFQNNHRSATRSAGSSWLFSPFHSAVSSERAVLQREGKAAF